jgi:hypothetical protein
VGAENVPTAHDAQNPVDLNKQIRGFRARQGRSSGVSAAAAGAGWRALTALGTPEARRV